MKVLSLFDGMACGYIAFDKLNIPIEEYYAYETDKFAIKTAIHNFPDIVECGDVFEADYSKHKDIDWLIGGSPCFAKGTMIKTIEGFKEIQDIKIGDLVLTHTGSYKKVYNTMSRITDNYCIVNSEGTEKIICTPNHAFYTKTMNRTYEKSKMKRKLSPDFSWTPVKDFQKQYKKDTILTHTYLCSVTDTMEYNPVYNGVEIKKNQFSKTLCNNLNLQDENLWYVIGRYLGDGWLRYKYKKGKKLLSGVCICCGKIEKEELEDRIKATKLHYYVSEERTTFRFTLTNLELATYLLQFGKGAKDKHLIQDVYFLPKRLMEYFLKGYLEADGCKGKSYYTYTSISKELAYGIKYCLTKFTNRPCNLYLDKSRTHILENRKIIGSDIYCGSVSLKETKQKHYFVEDNYIFTPFTKIEYINKPIRVYNFSVEEDESYTANGLVVHNCTFWSIAQNPQKRETKPEGFGWDLFSQYLRAIKEAKPKYFLYENNKSMSKDIKNCITENFGFDPILIDSALVSAQHRERLYWVGIRQSDGNYKKADICQPKDLGLSVKDVIGNIISKTKKDKSPALVNSYYKYGVRDSFSIHSLKRPGAIRKVGILPNKKGELKDAQATRIYSINGKSATLSSGAGGLGARTGLYAIPDNMFKVENKEIYYKDGKKYPLDVEDGYYSIRKLTVEECKKLQTVPESYDFSCVSNSQAYKMLGNGWTVDVICHLISETLKNNT